MLNFKSKTISEAQLIQQLSLVINQCEIEDFKTKKFIGLLYDYIPYHTGLKTRLDIIAQSGFLEEIIKLKGDPTQNSKKLERFALQLSSEYGFKLEIILSSILYVAKAVNIPVLDISEAPELGHLIKGSVSGNFSKNHRKAQMEMTTEGSVKSVSSANPQMVIESKNTKAQASGQKPYKYKKKWVRNKSNLLKIVLFVVAMLGGTYYLSYYFSNINFAFESVTAAITWPIYKDPLVMSTLLGSLILAGSCTLLYKKLKINLVSYLPLLMLLLQMATIVLKVEWPIGYEVTQIVILLGTLTSFIVLTGFSIRLPKGAKDFVSYKAITSYYATGIIYILGQYLVRMSV